MLTLNACTDARWKAGNMNAHTTKSATVEDADLSVQKDPEVSGRKLGAISKDSVIEPKKAVS